MTDVTSAAHDESKVAKQAAQAAENAAARQAFAEFAAGPPVIEPAGVPAVLGTAPENSLVRLDHFAYEPKDPREAYKIAKLYADSGLFKVHNPAAAYVIMALGRELGLSATQSMRSIYIVEGRPTLSAHLQAALVLRSNLAQYFECVHTTPEAAVYETVRRNSSGRVQQIVWTLQMAQTAGVFNRAMSPWKTYPQAMLRARAAVDLIRIVYPDVCIGLYDPDELELPVRIYAPRHDRELPIIEVLPEIPRTPEQIAADKQRLDALFGALPANAGPSIG